MSKFQKVIIIGFLIFILVVTFTLSVLFSRRYHTIQVVGDAGYFDENIARIVEWGGPSRGDWSILILHEYKVPTAPEHWKIGLRKSLAGDRRTLTWQGNKLNITTDPTLIVDLEGSELQIMRIDKREINELVELALSNDLDSIFERVFSKNLNNEK